MGRSCLYTRTSLPVFTLISQTNPFMPFGILWPTLGFKMKFVLFGILVFSIQLEKGTMSRSYLVMKAFQAIFISISRTRPHMIFRHIWLILASFVDVILSDVLVNSLFFKFKIRFMGRIYLLMKAPQMLFISVSRTNQEMSLRIL